MKKKHKHKKSAAIIAVAAIILISSCLYFYHINTSDSDPNANSSITSESSNNTNNLNNLSIDNDLSYTADTSKTSDTISDNSKNSTEVLLNQSDQLDLTVSASYAAAAYTDGKVIFNKNSKTHCYPASLTKLLTVSTAIKYISKDYMFTVGDELDLVCEGSSVAFLAKGDTLDFLTLVDALLLPSGNDAAYVMAVGTGRKYAGDESLSTQDALSVFITLMNQTATELGCTDSNFVTPDGYHDINHYTTASDMLKIAIHAYKLEMVRNSVCLSKARHVYSNNTKDITWLNTNLLLNADKSFFYEYAVGMKTGKTDEAGYCLVAVANKDGKEVVTVLMGATTEVDRYTDAINVFNSALGLS